MVGHKIALRLTLKHQITRGCQGAAIPHVIVLYAPYFLLLDRIPGTEMPFGHFLGQLLGEGFAVTQRDGIGHRIQTGIPAKGVVLVLRILLKEKRRFHGGDVHQAGLGRVRHGVPVMAAIR